MRFRTGACAVAACLASARQPVRQEVQAPRSEGTYPQSFPFVCRVVQLRFHVRSRRFPQPPPGLPETVPPRRCLGPRAYPRAGTPGNRRFPQAAQTKEAE